MDTAIPASYLNLHLKMDSVGR